MRAQDVLPDHVDQKVFGEVTVRKGSVGAFLANAAVLKDASLSTESRASTLCDIEELLPGLAAIGLFDVFEIKDPELRDFVGARLGVR